MTAVFSTNTKAGGSDLTPYWSTEIQGIATDDVSGVSTVTVSFKPCDGTDMNNRTAKCASVHSPKVSPCKLACTWRARLWCRTRLSCTWVTYPPVYPGVYVVTATARDRKGRIGRSAPIRIVVL